MNSSGFIYSEFFPWCLQCVWEMKMYYSWKVDELIYASAPDFSSGSHIPGKHLRLHRSFHLSWMQSNLGWDFLASFNTEEALRIFQGLDP